MRVPVRGCGTRGHGRVVPWWMCCVRCVRVVQERYAIPVVLLVDTHREAVDNVMTRTRDHTRAFLRTATRVKLDRLIYGRRNIEHARPLH